MSILHDSHYKFSFTVFRPERVKCIKSLGINLWLKPEIEKSHFFFFCFLFLFFEPQRWWSGLTTGSEFRFSPGWPGERMTCQRIEPMLIEYKACAQPTVIFRLRSYLFNDIFIAEHGFCEWSQEEWGSHVTCCGSSCYSL